MIFTYDEIRQGAIPTKEQEKNGLEIIRRVNLLAELIEKRCGVKLPPVPLVRWLRTEMQNEAVGGVKNSPHLTGEAIDIKDPNFIISQYILNNVDLLKEVGLYMENPYFCVSKATGNTWIHLQIRKASMHIFKPY